MVITMLKRGDKMNKLLTGNEAIARGAWEL